MQMIRPRLYDGVPFQIKKLLVEKTQQLKVGDVMCCETFTSAVIDKASFKNIQKYLDYACSQKHLKILCGGECDDRCLLFSPIN